MLAETQPQLITDYLSVDEQANPDAERTVAREQCNIHVLFVTHRPAALQFMIEAGLQQSPRVLVHGVPLSAPVMWSVPDGIIADAVVIDVADSPDEAVEVCRVLKRQLPDTPVLALLCCARPTLPAHVQSMLALGVTSVLDAHAEPRALFDAIGSLGTCRAVYVRLHDRSWMLEAPAEEARSTETPAADHVPRQHQKVLIRLVAQGLTNQEIGKVIHLASSTVHHQVGELCNRLGVANRVALAGWAGAHGFLRPAESGAD